MLESLLCWHLTTLENFWGEQVKLLVRHSSLLLKTSNKIHTFKTEHLLCWVSIHYQRGLPVTEGLSFCGWANAYLTFWKRLWLQSRKWEDSCQQGSCLRQFPCEIMWNFFYLGRGWEDSKRVRNLTGKVMYVKSNKYFVHFAIKIFTIRYLLYSSNLYF